jgi:hypothetical protein
MAGITIPLITEFKDKGIKQAMKEFKALETTGKKAQFALKKAALPAIAALGALAVAAGKALKAGEAVSTANARILQINKSMNLFGKNTKKVTDRLIKLAEKTAMATGMDNLAIKATQAKLLTFKNLAATADELGGAFDRAMLAAIDLAAAGFGTAESNAVQLGKALEDPIKGIAALSKSGVTFTKVEKEKIKVLVESGKLLEAQEIILKALETQVGGTAIATANSTDIMREGFAQFQQQLGLALLPVLEKVTPLLLKIANWAKNNPGVFLAIASAVGILAVSILAVNAAMLLNPAVLITAGIIALGVAVVAAYKKFEGLQTVIRVVVNGVLSYVEDMVNAFIIGVNVMIRAMNLIPGVDIDTIGHVSLTRISDKAPDLSSNDRGMGGFIAPALSSNDRGMGGAAGQSNNVTINVQGADPNAVVQALQRYVRTSGPVPVNIRAM